jgi:23S rRNA (pseudouridine1915-N3)-methyltransferase
MLLRVIAAGTRLPQWINAGFEDYASRLTQEYRLELKEIALGQRSGSASAPQAIEKEGERMLAALPPKAFIVALQVTGKSMSSEQLAAFLEARAQDGRDIAFLIGGPDGIAPQLDAKANLRWSLSALTLPHALARVVVAEALYRAVTIVKGLPYHRGGGLAARQK